MPLLSEPSSYEQLKYAQESIAQSVAQGLDSFAHYTGRLLDVVPTIIAGLRGATDTTSKYPKIAPLSTDQATFLKLIDGHKYLEVREIKGYVPQGLKVTFLEEAETLHRAAQRCRDFPAAVLEPYVTYLAHLSSSGDALRSMDDHAVLHQKLAAGRAELIAEQRAHYERFSTKSRAKVGDIVARNADWAPMLQSVNAVKSTIEGVDRGRVDDLIRQAQDYLEILYGKLEKNQIGAVNPEVCMALSEGAYQIGCELELFGMVYFWVLALQGAVNNTVDEVTRVLAK